MTPTRFSHTYFQKQNTTEVNVRRGCIVHIRWCIDHNLSQRSPQSHTTHTQTYALSQSIRRSCKFARIHICGTRGPPCYYVFSASRTYICICLFGRRWGSGAKVRSTSGQVPLMARGGATTTSEARTVVQLNAHTHHLAAVT